MAVSDESAEGLVPSLEQKMRIVLGAVLEIERAKDENDAILSAMVNLERLQYPSAMLSFLKTIEGKRFIVAELPTGDKWKRIAEKTKRPYDCPKDLLPKVLHRNASRFVRDSRNDPEGECDAQLCRELSVISQYAMPLATETMKIGTLQVDMGERSEQPVVECTMLDALASHLSVAIERHRMLAQLEVVNSELMNQAKIIAFEAAAGEIMHHLNHSIGDYGNRLVEAMRGPEIRTNKAALEFLRFTQKQVVGWIDYLQEKIGILKTGEEETYDVEEITRQTVSIWQRKARLRNCNLRGEFNAQGATVRVKLGSFRELLSCLVINAIEANAREIRVEVALAARADLSPDKREWAEIVVSDDGDGIPVEQAGSIGSFGWTSKAKTGHGMGLTIVSLITRKMGGNLELRSYGKPAGEPRTVFAVQIPRASEGRAGQR